MDLKTEIKFFRLALDGLMNEIELLKQQNIKFKQELEYLKKQGSINQVSSNAPTVTDTTLLDTKEVLRILGICYNTLQRIVEKGLLKPIRINQRRVRYTQKGVLNYLRIKLTSLPNR